MKYISILIYIGLGLLHLFLVKNMMFLVILVGLFEVVRLLAVWQKIRLVVVVLAIFSSVFIIINYLNMYENNQSNIAINTQINSQINNYTNKYWTNQETFKSLVEKQESIIKNVVNLPSPYIVGVLIALIELSMAYIVCNFKPQVNSNNTKNKQKIDYFLPFLKADPTRVFNTKNNENIVDIQEFKQRIQPGNKLQVINDEYFIGNKKIGRTTYYKLLREQLKTGSK